MKKGIVYFSKGSVTMTPGGYAALCGRGMWNVLQMKKHIIQCRRYNRREVGKKLLQDVILYILILIFFSIGIVLTNHGLNLPK